MLYLDSSVLVCLFSNEDRTPTVRAWRLGLNADQVCASEWNIAEFYSAMSFKRRTGQMTIDQRRIAEMLFENYLRRYPIIFSVTSYDFRRAAAIAGRDDVNVRAADALHLAIAEAQAATICTLDLKMERAAGILGIDCHMP